MDALFSILDGAAALWLSLFSARRYLRIVARIKFSGKGARNYFETYLRMNLIPAVLAGSLSQYNQALLSKKVDSILTKENMRHKLQPGELHELYQRYFSDDQVTNFLNLLQSKTMVELSIFVGSMVTFYSLSRSREFGQTWRKQRHALQLITANALTILVVQIIPVAAQSIFLLSVDVDSVVIPDVKTKEMVVRYAMIAANGGLSDTSAVQAFLIGLIFLLQLLTTIVSIRLLVITARSLRIGFWRSIWLQTRYALPFAAVLFVLGGCVGLGMNMASMVVAAVAPLLAIGVVITLVPSGREWVSRRLTPARERKVVKPVLARIRVVQGSLAGTVVPVSTKLVIGRDPASSSIVFPAGDALVSRRHCEIRFDPKSGLFEVRDLGSRNGTFIFDGINVARRIPPDRTERIAPGQNVFVGSSRERLVLEVI